MWPQFLMLAATPFNMRSCL